MLPKLRLLDLSDHGPAEIPRDHREHLRKCELNLFCHSVVLKFVAKVGGGLPAAMLTSAGLRQTKELGLVLRRQYVDSGFISPTYDPGAVPVSVEHIRLSFLV